MKLRTNLFLIFGGLLLILLLLQWWVLTNVSRNIQQVVETSVFKVSKDTAAAVVLHQLQSKKIIVRTVTEDAEHKITTLNKDDETEIQHLREHYLWTKSDDNSGDGQLRENVFIELNKELPKHKIRIQGDGIEQVIDVQNQGLESQLRGLSSQILLSMLSILVLGLVVVAYFSHRLSTPLEKLKKAAQWVAEGETGKQIAIDKLQGPSEVLDAIKQFNQMSLQLAQLEKHNQQLQDKQQLNELGAIAKGFAHSLRNPLNTLGLAVDELATEELDNQRKTDLHRMVLRQIGRIDQWIKNFMTLNQEQDQVTAICLNALIEDLVLEFKSGSPDILWHFEWEKDFSIVGLETELQTIFQVLLENAVEASHQGQTIKLNLYQQDETLYFEVQDQGEGIAPELADQVFTPNLSTKSNGTGMGLFLARRLARGRYQGDIQLLSTSTGTKASLSLSILPKDI